MNVKSILIKKGFVYFIIIFSIEYTKENDEIYRCFDYIIACVSICFFSDCWCRVSNIE